MNGLEKIKYKSENIAFVVRRGVDVKDGIKFFTRSDDPLQIALHSYKSEKETNIHHNKLSSPIIQKRKYKYIYIINGKASVELSIKTGKVIKKLTLKRGDSIVIMDIYHKVIFSSKSRAIEIKQGPYSNG